VFNGVSPGGTAAAADSETQETISFAFFLSAFPVVHFINADGTPPAECPGTVHQPAALAGHLCLYSSKAENVDTVCVFNPDDDNCGEAAVRGFGVGITSGDAGDFWLQGSWAVTAP
jgi:hypothetical protein